MGRKRLQPEQARQKPLRIRLSAEERRLVDEAAEAEGHRSTSAWARRTLLTQASRCRIQGRTRMARFWCVNFDAEEVLQHGLQHDFWAMQYQYSHGGHVYQGSPNQLHSTTKHLKAVVEVEAGDWLVAYLKPKTFYAVGEVIVPRQRAGQRGHPVHEDSIERTVSEQTHRFLDGIVRYTETRVYYDDFTDPWVLSGINSYSEQRENWKYPQRIDVRQWEDKCAGVQVDGLAEAVAFPLYRLAVFEIPASFFEIIRAGLRS
jgi:hypothetical protein